MIKPKFVKESLNIIQMIKACFIKKRI